MPDDTATDEELMLRLKAGEDRALSILMTRWELPIRRYLVRMLRYEADALDTAQEAFVRVYQHRDRFVPEGHFKAWLFAIATNLARSRHRWWKRHPTEALPEEADGHGVTPEALREEATPANSLRDQEKFAAVRSAVATLPEELRAVTVLFEFEGLSHAEIATVLHCSAKAVETRLYRARRQLRTTLAAFVNDDDASGPQMPGNSVPPEPVSRRS